MIQRDARIYVAGGRTVAGAAILRELARQGYDNVVGKAGEEPDLTNASLVDWFFRLTNPEYVFLVAGKSGGIGGNLKRPAEFMLNNLLVECHVIQSAYRQGIKKLLYLASCCIYPKHALQPMRVDSLLSGPLEPTNEAYALAKIAGLKLIEAYRQQFKARFITAIPANIFGPEDDFDPDNAHVIAALLRRMHEAKELGAKFVEVWGTGAPLREFIYADDLADACIFVMREYDDASPINVGGGEGISIKDLATRIQNTVGYEGELRFEAGRPDGMPLKILDSRNLRGMGWRPKTPFDRALECTYRWFLENYAPRCEALPRREIQSTVGWA